LAPAQQEASTLRETLASAELAISSGDFRRAADLFTKIETAFGQEPEVKKPQFRITVIPLHAYAALRVGETDVAIQLFEDFLQSFPDDRSRAPFVLFNLAQAYEKNDDPAKAIETYRRFVAIDPDRPESALATLSAAELMFESGEADAAFDALDSLYERQPAGVIRNKARLTALQKALDLGSIEAAKRYLLDEPWDLENLQELTVFNFSALEMGRSLLEARQYDKAIACFRLVLPYETLTTLQERRLYETRARFDARMRSAGLFQGVQFWSQFYNRLIARLEQQNEKLQTVADYTASFHLSYGQAYLLAGRPHEAYLIFETLARETDLPEAVRSEAHYRWILAAVEIGLWEDAFTIAKAFGQRYPDSPLAPDALYLLATTYQEARRYRDAVEVLDAFLARFGADDLAPRALFVRGYNYNLLNEPELARRDFEAFTSKHPSHGLFQDARFWRALTFFAERDYAATLTALEELRSDVQGHRLEAEVAYRIASTHYAMKDYDTALQSINRYLEAYPMHSRREEARVLLGDIQMGRGELTQARVTFASIQPEAGHLFAYAVFQTGKILRAVAGAEDRGERDRAALLEAHVEHFQNYVAREDVPNKERISEALYWIGWTYIEQGKPERARETFASALEKYGDAIEAGQVLNIIEALARVEKRITLAGKADREAAMREWVEAQKTEALESDRLTYYARLNFYLDSMYPSYESGGFLFQNVEKVPLDRLDAEGLGRIAAALVEDYPRVAEPYLVRLEDAYPDSRFRTYGYYARAVLLMQAGDYEEAGDELSRFLGESPMHPLASRVTLRYAECLTRTDRFDEARETLEGILTLRQARGRPHAEALLGLSRNAEAAGQLERAIPYAQRVYNVYRAYPDLSADAYWMSALQFDKLGDPVAAYRTLEEMLQDPRILQLPIASEAKNKRDALLRELPEGALEEADEATETEPAPVQTANLEAAK